MLRHAKKELRKWCIYSLGAAVLVSIFCAVPAMSTPLLADSAKYQPNIEVDNITDLQSAIILAVV